MVDRGLKDLLLTSGQRLHGEHLADDDLTKNPKRRFVPVMNARCSADWRPEQWQGEQWKGDQWRGIQ